MSMSKSFKSSAGKLPKSVKVRSTCNACQQAKIRCSHEKPSCRRCQKHKIDCVYSVSRRLGRPAKKKEPRPGLEGQGSNPDMEMVEHQKRAKQVRKTTKKKGHGQVAGSGSGMRPRAARTSIKTAEDNFQSSIASRKNGDDLSGLQIDIASETWLQELASTRMNWSMGNFPLENPYEMDLEDNFDSFSECVRQTDPSGYQMTDPFLPSPSLGPDPMGSDPILVETKLEGDFNSFQHSLWAEHLESPYSTEPSVASWAYGLNTGLDGCIMPDPWSVSRMPPTSFLLDPATGFPPFESGTSHGSEEFSPETPDLLGALDGTPYQGCGCYKQAISELLRSGIKSDPSGVSSIDSILACQKELLLQVGAILQCKMCSQSDAQANMLMVVIVTIDSLLTSLDAAATSNKAGTQDELSAVGAQDGRRNQKNMGGGFKSHIDACPLLVGRFRVPAEEKMCFIRQVLQSRLSMLMIMIRRIRACMQQHLASALSRGRLLMIMETDRRLQLIMMKVKMAVG